MSQVSICYILLCQTFVHIGADNTEGEERESGSTATVVLARKDKLVIANVGDSRAVLSRSGKPIDLSAEHR